MDFPYANDWLHGVHPWRLTWNIVMEVWKIIFLSKWVICRFHVNLPGCSILGWCQSASWSWWKDSKHQYCLYIGELGAIPKLWPKRSWDKFWFGRKLPPGSQMQEMNCSTWAVQNQGWTKMLSWFAWVGKRSAAVAQFSRRSSSELPFFNAEGRFTGQITSATNHNHMIRVVPWVFRQIF